MDDGPYHVMMALGIIVILGWCGVIGYSIYHHVTGEACTCEEAP